MDISDITPLFRALRTLLNPGAQFIATLMHPAFNHPDSVRGVEQFDLPNGETVKRTYIKAHEYLGACPVKGIGIPGQAHAHWYFPRSLHDIFNIAFGAGFVVDGFEEAAWNREEGEEKNLTPSWKDMTKLPPVVAIRFRVL
ncbi:hypothetical protein BC936DRAFT_140233 [Jimgerdemannia flammicorona]|uniref:Methyltransferase type 11 domain-containing protein n=1 Tax=Jimgerdemannia flammicorona TaxID=994334 RepID=A0A433DH10_9FUNG|nr:hypothetical protein BC936DRAFT_140233 [Jimgerdemannia flammicorona]